MVCLVDMKNMYALEKCVAQRKETRKRKVFGFLFFCFFELEYWSLLQFRHNIDIMHVKKNMCHGLLRTILDKEKSKDTLNIRCDLAYEYKT